MESYFIPSDERIKECICPLNELLPKLDQINFVSYDRMGINKICCDVGFIAQNVVKVFPSMVSISEGYLPNIKQKVEHTLMADDIVFIRMINTLPLNENDNVLFNINSPGENITRSHITTIIHATDVSIEINKWINYSPTDELFLYGSNVEDFHSVDATQIGVLGAACVKELYQVVKCQAETIASLQKQIDDIAARLS
jgi:hypothetical protein